MQASLCPGAAPARAARPGRARAVSVSAAFAFPSLFAGNKVEKRAEAKAQLLEAISTLDRGVKATVEDRELVDGLAAQLEKLNPTPKPLASPLLNGRWRLLYTTSPTVLGLNKPPFFRPSGPIYQFLDGPSLTARNMETAPFFNQVKAELEPLSANKVAVQFKEFRIFNLIAVQAPPTARGELAITYLDEDLRLSRGDKGNLFVLTMDGRDQKP